jgi:alpha-tubulin suppressor-like RCC1 family protein
MICRSWPGALLLILASLGCEEDEEPPPERCRLEEDNPRVVDLQGNESIYMALLSDGTAYCWGEDVGGACGYTAGWAPFPLRVPSATCLVGIAPGSIGVSLGIGASGELLVWGNELNLFEAGDGPARGPGPEKHTVLPVPDPIAASIENHGLAITEAGELYYWGGNSIEAPQLYPSPGRVVLGELNRGVACFLIENGEVYCFGPNSQGQLGQPNLDPAGSYEPVRVALPGPATKVEAGNDRACALVNGEVWCWGDNGGQITGVPWEDLPYTATPLKVPDLPPAKDLFLEWAGACVLDESDHAHCWGTAITIPKVVSMAFWPPVPWRHELQFKKLAVGDGDVCGLTLDDRVFCEGPHNGLGYPPPDLYPEPDGSGDQAGFVDIAGAIEKAKQKKTASP